MEFWLALGNVYKVLMETIEPFYSIEMDARGWRLLCENIETGLRQTGRSAGLTNGDGTAAQMFDDYDSYHPQSASG